MNGILILLACICIVRVFVEFESLVDEPGMSFAGGSFCPQASQLHCVREQRASNLKHKDCCFHHLHLQTLFVESNFVRQLDLRFLSF